MRKRPITRNEVRALIYHIQFRIKGAGVNFRPFNLHLALGPERFELEFADTHKQPPPASA